MNGTYAEDSNSYTIWKSSDVAEAAGKYPIQFRLDLLKRVKKNPIGEKNDYESDLYADVLESVNTKSNWAKINKVFVLEIGRPLIYPAVISLK